MEDVFTPKSLNIKILFTESLFQVPDYQRPYSWEDEHVEQLWDDIYDSYTNEDKNYFLGSVITVEQENGNREDIVDGQQRLTTLMILFCVIRDTYPGINEDIDTEEDTQAITIKTLRTCIKDVEGRKRIHHLATQDVDQNDFERVILEKIDFEKLKKPSKKQVNNEVKSRFLNTAYIFKEKFEKLVEETDEKEIGHFINYLFNKVKIIKIYCKNRSFAIKLFQILNDRGLDLTHSDLIKSSLMSNLDKDKQKQFIADWNSTVQIIKDINDMNMDDLFILYEYYQLAANPKNSLSEEINKIFEKKDSNEAINEFKEFCKLYKTSICDVKDKIIYSFWYIRWSMYWKAILLTALKEDFPDYKELSKELRRFYYIYWIAGKTLTKVKQTSFNIINWIRQKEPISSIKENLNKKIKQDGVLSQAIDNLRGENIYYEKWIKPVLLMIEYHIGDGSNLNYIEWDNKLHTEHILPIEYKKHSKWNHITPEVEKEFLHSIGNLTLLSGKKNIEASNAPFEEKLRIYEGKGRYKDKKEGITAFKITQKIVNDSKGDQFPIWNKNSMESRQKWYLSAIESILNIDCSNIRK